MNLLRLLTRFGLGPLYRLGAGAAISALASTLLLAIVNTAAGEIAGMKGHLVQRVNLWLAGGFAVCVVIYALTETWTVARMGADVEAVIDRLRMGLVENLRLADLWKLDHFGQARLYDSITQSSQAISMNSQFLALSLRALLLTLAVLVYIAWISPLAFLVVSGFLIFCAIGYRRLGRALNQRQELSARMAAGLFESITDLFDGFKEQRLSSARSRDLGLAFGTVSTAVTRAQNDVHLHGWRQYVFAEMVFTLMLGSLVFVVPAYSPVFSHHVVKAAAAVMFMFGQFAALLQTVTLLGAADSAAGRMLDLERDLAGLAEEGGGGAQEPVPEEFTELKLNGVEFAFPAPAGEQPFVVGPIDFSLRRGETVFVTGGNGSGKSTFIRLLTGLYHPLRGHLAVDGMRIGPERYDGYRRLMATVFSDFHLFARLYDVPASVPEGREAHDLMRWMEMAEVTTLDNGRFGRRDLSSGQRKRLGLIAALLEGKPILILDEWAADQDPYFRRKFYREIVPALKARGLTIVAVTHDDSYFDMADRRVRMEEGRIVEEFQGGEATCG